MLPVFLQGRPSLAFQHIQDLLSTAIDFIDRKKCKWPLLRPRIRPKEQNLRAPYIILALNPKP